MTNHKITGPEEGPVKSWLIAPTIEGVGVENKKGQNLEKSKPSFAWKITLPDVYILTLIMF